VNVVLTWACDPGCSRYEVAACNHDGTGCSVFSSSPNRNGVTAPHQTLFSRTYKLLCNGTPVASRLLRVFDANLREILPP
jgi:hypothetical protein